MSKVPLYPSKHEIAASTMGGASQEPLAEKMADWANAGDPAAVEMLDLLIEEGGYDEETGKLSEKLLDTIGSLTADVQLSIKLKVDKKGYPFNWIIEPSKTEIIPSSKAAYALVIADLLESFEVDQLHQCEECGKYFVGDPRSMWCSKACGNRSRQRAFQERKRAKKKRSKK